MKHQKINLHVMKYFLKIVTIPALAGLVILSLRAEATESSLNPNSSKKENKMTENPQKLIIEDIQIGQGATPQKGQRISVHYTGTLLSDGTKFDSSLDRGVPITFTLGVGQVIRGWDEGFEGMKVGGKRKLIIPSDMAYGARGAGDVIPPHAPLVFEVELVAVN